VLWISDPHEFSALSKASLKSFWEYGFPRRENSSAVARRQFGVASRENDRQFWLHLPNLDGQIEAVMPGIAKSVTTTSNSGVGAQYRRELGHRRTLKLEIK
jgi:hypothetical protein